MILPVLLGLWLTMWAAKGTQIGRTLRHWMVVHPATRLARISRGQVLLFLVLAGLALAVIWLLENDGRMLVALGLPDIVSLAVAIDAGSLLDLAVVALMTAATVRSRAIVTRLRHRVTPRRPRPRAVRAHRMTLPANDGEDRPALAA